MARKFTYTINASSDLATYQFISTSNDRIINKRVEFENLNENFEGRCLYNLAFGDIGKNGEIDDESELNNGDIIKVLATVLSTIYEFTAAYPERAVYFTGSNQQRTGFYQEIMRRKHKELVVDFNLYGEVKINENESEFEAFDLCKSYTGFVVTRTLKEEKKFD